MALSSLSFSIVVSLKKMFLHHGSQPLPSSSTKKEATDDPSNFRPIALMSCIYKLLMGIIAKRLTSWAITNNLLSNEQKSAHPSEGCYEHTFLLQSIVGDARRLQKNIYLAWLDLKNAFGSIPHSAISTTLSHMGIPPSLIEFIMNAYTGASTRILTSVGLTEVPVLAGVKQGCPLSPILFNLTIELIIRSIKNTAKSDPCGPALHHKIPLSTLAYADDLVLVAHHKISLRNLLDTASASAKTLGLIFRPDKSAYLSFTNSKRAPEKFPLTSFKVQNKIIPALKEEEHCRHLGIPIGMIHNMDVICTMNFDLSEDLEKIEKSLLAPWQKLDPIRRFIQPCFTFILRVGCTLKKSIADYHSSLVRTIKNICNLPSWASSSYIFASKHIGGLVFHDPEHEIDIQTIVQAIKKLSSDDQVVADIARAELYQTVRHAL